MKELHGIDRELRNAFRLLDHSHLLTLGTGLPLTTDFRRVVMAFAHLSTAKPGVARELLDALSNDGSASAADIAYVKAFQEQCDGNLVAVPDILEPHFDAADATMGGRMRLRAADALLRMRQYQRCNEALGPLLQPPGVGETLEAHFIVLEAMLSGGAPKDQLVEQVVMIDGLMEKKFRLLEPVNVVYYTNLLVQNRIEPPIEALLNNHSILLDRYTPDDRDEILLLLTAGEKYRAPAAVRAAARGYIKAPFPIEGMSADRASYLFSTHDEHEAARQAIIMGFPKNRIRKEQDLWGALLLSTYHAGHWQQTIDMLREHRDALRTSKLHDNSRMIRAVCEHQLGRHRECLETVKALGPAFYTEAAGEEATVEALSHALHGNLEEMRSAIGRAFDARKKDQEWINSYSTLMLSELAIHDMAAAWNVWVDFLASYIRPEIQADTLQRVGDMAIEWAMYPGAMKVEELLAASGQSSRNTLLKAYRHADLHETELALATFDETEKLWPANAEKAAFELVKARCLRRLGLTNEALAIVDSLSVREGFMRQHCVHAIRAGILRDQGDEEGYFAALEAAHNFVSSKAQSAAAATLLRSEIRWLSRGDRPENLLVLLQEVVQKEWGSIEVLRLSRKVMRLPDTTAEQLAIAKDIHDRWRAVNVPHIQ